MAEPEDVLGCAAGIGIVLPEGQGTLMMQQSIQNVSCLASVSRDYLGVEPCKPVGDVVLELYAWLPTRSGRCDRRGPHRGRQP